MFAPYFPSGTKKTHDLTVDQLPDLFRTTHRVKTQSVTKNRGQQSADIELPTYLGNVEGPVSLVLDLRIPQDRREVPLILVLMVIYITPLT